MSGSIFGVRLDDVSSPREFRAVCGRFLVTDRTHSIFTPNPEILLRARSDRRYAALLNSADLLLPDGVGIVMVQRLGGRRPVRRWPGIDAAELVLDVVARAGGRVLLLGGREGAAATAARTVRRMWPQLEIETAGDSTPFAADGTAASPKDDAEIERRIAEAQPEVVLVGLGAPKQERWIARHVSSFPSVRIMMGVGGALDMWSGRPSRAPRPLRSVGLEWLWRLMLQPSRLPRTLRSTLLFPWHALREPERS